MFVYTISYKDNIIYVGSTLQTWGERLSGHKRDLKRNKGLLYKFMNEQKIDFDQVIINLYPKDFEIDTTGQFRTCNELKLAEGELQQKFLSDGVKLYQSDIAGRTWTKWYNDNQEKIKENNKTYREKNKERLHNYETNIRVRPDDYKQKKAAARKLKLQNDPEAREKKNAAERLRRTDPAVKKIRAMQEQGRRDAKKLEKMAQLEI